MGEEHAYRFLGIQLSANRPHLSLPQHCLREKAASNSSLARPVLRYDGCVWKGSGRASLHRAGGLSTLASRSRRRPRAVHTSRRTSTSSTFNSHQKKSLSSARSDRRVWKSYSVASTGQCSGFQLVSKIRMMDSGRREGGGMQARGLGASWTGASCARSSCAFCLSEMATTTSVLRSF